MFAWLLRIAALSLILGVACGGDETTDPAEPTEPETRQAVDPVLEEPDDEELLEDEEEPLDVDVDEMDEHALEAACFAGQQAACDRLGH
ncbi:MAG: hypothetical protein ACI9KE_000227 [Polyangiales bacterium]